MSSKLTSELQLILTDEQFAAYQAATGGGGGRKTDGLTGTGTIWVMRDGEPASVAVRTGLADTQYTEIQSNELVDGDEVIIRAVVLLND
jgi:hypothetical protein